MDLRDGDKGTYLGNSVTKAVKNINDKISEALIGRDPTQQYEIDQAMKDLDTTEKKVPIHLFVLNSQILWECNLYAIFCIITVLYYIWYSLVQLQC